MTRVWIFFVLAGCTSGEHQTLAAICDATPDPAAGLATKRVDQIERQLEERLRRAGLTVCRPQKTRRMQLGARPVKWYCGAVDGVDIEAAINRPGERGCPLELDVRADLSGTRRSVAEKERRLVAFVNGHYGWFGARLARIPRGTGTVTSLRRSGAWLALEDDLW
jgi:hypothetical protein